ncbi:MAG: prolyl oligopeptidase family serine peptidase [Rubrivivax sp.]
MNTEDPYCWLEDVLGERALAWVRERNAQSEAELQAVPGFEQRRQATLQVLDSQDRIPAVHRIGGLFYNLWQDADHPRGLWRRTTLDEYRRPQPAWETVLDLDALSAAEGENWVWGGADALGPAYRRCLLHLSRGGADAQVVREFDLVAKRFVDGGFFVPEAKSSLSWIDEDTVYIGSDFGPGSLTDSGYPRVIKRWRRGQPLDQAPTVFEGESTDVLADAWVDRTPGFERSGFYRSVGFYDSRSFLLRPDGALAAIDKPDDAAFSFWRDRVLIQLRSEWTAGGRTWPRGSLLVADAAAYLRGERALTALFTPGATCSLSSYSLTRSTVLLNLLDNVSGRLEECTPDAAGGGWQRREVATPGLGTLAASALHDPLLADDPLAESYWLRRSGFLEPDTLELGRTGSDERAPVKALPAFFDASGMRVEQRFARSADGTRVPYFVVWPRQPRGDGRNPTLLYGYGGFEVALAPWYLGATGRTWLEPGGVFVVANIRGGGEFGPEWHQAAVKARKQRSYDDFAAVAEDLIAGGVTRPEHLGIQGGSNGGLLVGTVMLQRPELFGAVVCQVPLLDMRRYHRLLAGASWMAEYGDPDRSEDWAWIGAYSPYQKLRDLPPGTRLPPVLFITSTRDDRVHPGHARKMAALMQQLGHRALYWENIEGGHGGAADNAQRARMRALELSFLWQRLAVAC